MDPGTKELKVSWLFHLQVNQIFSDTENTKHDFKCIKFTL